VGAAAACSGGDGAAVVAAGRDGDWNSGGPCIGGGSVTGRHVWAGRGDIARHARWVLRGRRTHACISPIATFLDPPLLCACGQSDATMIHLYSVTFFLFW